MASTTNSNNAIFKKMLGFFIAAYVVSGEIIKLFLLEFKLAKRSVIVVFFCCVTFVFLLFSAWLLLLSIFIFLFNMLFHEWIMSFILTIGINVLFAGIILWCITEYLQDLAFSHTRKHIFGQKEKSNDDLPATEKPD